MTRKGVALGAALVLALSACDLEVINPNAPDRERALATAGDVETLISGTFSRQWWLTQMGMFTGNAPATPIFANQSFEMSSWPANSGMVFWSQLPRVPTPNDPTAEFYVFGVEGFWTRAYRCLSPVAQGLQSLEDPAIAGQFEPNELTRLRAFSRMMQGLCHGVLATWYREAWILDETTEIIDEATGLPAQLEPVPYTEVLDAALGFLDLALDEIATGPSFSIPSGWMSTSVGSDELVGIINAYKARLRASVARTPDERQNLVDWNAVRAEAQAGIPWSMQTAWFDAPFMNEHVAIASLSWIGWNQSSYMINGMADQSGRYEEWLVTMDGTDAESRHPNLPSGPFLIVTPDERFPQGETIEEQEANQGTMREINGGPFFGANNWSQPARGTHRWSYYRPNTADFHLFDIPTNPVITQQELDLLVAEAELRIGDPGTAASIINQTRTAAGLNATDAGGTNTSCVPRIPTGASLASLDPADAECGDLMEMLKWEKRMHTQFFGLHLNSWYLDGRGWGDLYEGTPLELPVPCLDVELTFPGQACEDTGGVGGPSASPGSIYPLEPQ